MKASLNLKLGVLILVAGFVLAFIWLSGSSTNESNQQDEDHKSLTSGESFYVAYEINWLGSNSGESLSFDNPNGLSFEIDKASINLDSVQVVSCAVSDSGSTWSLFSGVAHAGHSPDEPNTALIRDIQSVDLLNPVNDFPEASINEPNYCAIHVAAGSSGSEVAPSISLSGTYWPTDSPASIGIINVESNTSYGYRHDFNSEVAAADLGDIEINFDISTMLDSLNATSVTDSNVVAKEVLKQILDSAEYKYTGVRHTH